MKNKNGEGQQIERLADMRVSNALIINKHRQRDSFIKRVIDDAHIEYGKQKMKTMFFDKKNEEGHDMAFEEASHFIEMTPRTPLDSIQTDSEERKDEGEIFANFYKQERTMTEVPQLKLKRKNTLDPEQYTNSKQLLGQNTI